VSEDEPAEDNLIAFNSGDIFFTATRQPAHFYCSSQCKKIVLDEHKRQLTCRECGRVIEPFDYLLQWAHENDRRTRSLKELDVQIRQRSEEARALKVEIQLLKAQRRRHGRSCFRDAGKTDTTPEKQESG
jgi:hypothetical protein